MKKRKFIRLVLIFASALSLFAAGLGDVNEDGRITIVDALLTAQYYVNLHPDNFNPGYGDLNEDGQINIVDALLMAQIYVGMATAPPENTPYITPTPEPDLSVYMFSYFTGDGDDGLHLAYSYDCQNWTALKRGASFLTPIVGDRKMRDPSIQQDAKGVFHLVWTDTSWTEMGENNQANKGFGYSSSPDLINWSTQRFVGVMEGTRAENTWAPEISWDDLNQTWMIYWSSTVPPTSGHRIYYTTTNDFINYSQTQKLFDPGYTVIDSAIFKYSQGRYAMVFKDESSKDIWISESASPRGPWGARRLVYTVINAEGPSPAFYNNNWHVVYDQYGAGSWGMSRSSDLNNWSEATVSMPSGARHGTIFRVSRDFLNSLRSALGE